MKKTVLFVISVCFIILGACSNNTNGLKNDSGSQKEVDHANHTSASSGDIREETRSVGVLPKFLNDKPEDMQNLYKAAAMNKELLENIPCYCGCGESVGHKSNYDCFVYKYKKDNSIVWDDHGTNCNVCLEIAAKSISKFKEGKSSNEVRKMIDEEYKEGYAKPTPTPQV